MLSFVICLRVSELVGIDSIEQYLPHRVAMQFGMDQDVPSYVPRLNETKENAWRNYCRPISDENLFHRDCLRQMLRRIMQTGGSNQ